MVNFDFNKCSNRLLIAMAKELKHPKRLQQLLEFKEELVYKAIASNQYTYKNTLGELYRKYKGEVVGELIKNSSTPEEVLHDIATWCTVKQAQELINNYSLATCDIDLLVDRFIDEESIVISAIKNEQTQGKTLIKITNEHPELIEQVMGTGKVILSVN